VYTAVWSLLFVYTPAVTVVTLKQVNYRKITDSKMLPLLSHITTEWLVVYLTYVWWATQYNKQPMGGDAQPAGTQTGRRKCPGRGRNVYGNCSAAKCPEANNCLVRELPWKKHTGKNIQIAVQDYKSPVKITVVMICETLVNTQTHTHRQTTSDWLYY